MSSLYQKFVSFSENYIKDFALLMLRLLLAYAFLHPALMKWADMNSIIYWFDSLGIPLPTLNAYMAATVEILGVLLLTIGLGTRIIAIPLIVTMLVAIVTVHGDNGWLAIASSELNPMAAEKLSAAKSILKEHGNYDWLTQEGSFVILQNGMEFVVTYIAMLLALISFGSGRFSLDFLFNKLKEKNTRD